MPNPFGLAAGQTPDSDVAAYWVNFHEVPKPHPDFKEYSGKWTPEQGLIAIMAYSKLFNEDAAGYSVIRLYDRLKSQLESVYGPSQSAEFIDDDALWSGHDEFIQSILTDERCHFTQWTPEHGSRLDAGIKEINLAIMAESNDAAKVMLRYEFTDDSRAGPGMSVGLSSL